MTCSPADGLTVLRTLGAVDVDTPEDLVGGREVTERVTPKVNHRAMIRAARAR